MKQRGNGRKSIAPIRTITATYQDSVQRTVLADLVVRGKREGDGERKRPSKEREKAEWRGGVMMIQDLIKKAQIR